MIFEARCLRSGLFNNTEYGMGFWFPSRRSLHYSARLQYYYSEDAYILTWTANSVRSRDVAKLKASIVSGGEAVDYRMPWMYVIRVVDRLSNNSVGNVQMHPHVPSRGVNG